MGMKNQGNRSGVCVSSSPSEFGGKVERRFSAASCVYFSGGRVGLRVTRPPLHLSSRGRPPRRTTRKPSAEWKSGCREAYPRLKRLLRNSDCDLCGGTKYGRDEAVQPRSGDVVLDPGVSPGQSGKYAGAAERRSSFRNRL